MSLWILSLGLCSKEWSAHLLSGLAVFSLPFALGGWLCLALDGMKTPRAILGGILVAVASALWPPHLFAAAGVLIVSLLWRNWLRMRLILGVASLLGFSVGLYLRRVSGAEESIAVFQKWPDSIPQFIGQRLLAIASFGSDAHGWFVIIAAVAITTVLIFLVALGWRARKQQAMIIELGRFAVGLFLGVLLAAVFLRLTSYANRLLFVTAIMLAPVAAVGVRQFLALRAVCARRYLRFLFAGLYGLWLVPSMLAVAVTGQQWHEWNTHGRPTTNFLSENCSPKDRIWAETEDYCQIALGQAPVFGLLGHPDPTYFSPPSKSAEYLGSAYYRLLESPSVRDCLDAASEVKIKWIVLRRQRTPLLPWMEKLGSSHAPAFANEEWLIYDVSSETTIPN